MLGNYYIPAASSTESTINTIYQEQQQDLPVCAMDSGQHQESPGSSPSHHPVKLSIRSLLDSTHFSESGFDAEGFSFTPSPRQSPQWEGQAEEREEEGGREEDKEEEIREHITDTNSDGNESMAAIANVQASLAAAAADDRSLSFMDVQSITAANSRPSPSLTVRLTLEGPPSMETTSGPRLRRRRSSTSNTELGDDREKRKSLRLSRPSSAVEVRVEKKESFSPTIPLAQLQRIRLRSPKRRSPSPRRQGGSTDPTQMTNNKRLKMRAREDTSEGGSPANAGHSPSPSSKVAAAAASLSPSVVRTERRVRLRSRSPRRASNEVIIPSSSLRSSPMRGTRPESSVRTSPKTKSSPSRVNNTAIAAASEIESTTNKIRIRLRPSLEASSTESVNGGPGEEEIVTTRSRKTTTNDDEFESRRQSTSRERRGRKKSSNGKNVAREASTSRKSNRRTNLSKNANDTSPPHPTSRAVRRMTRASPRRSPSRKGKAVATPTADAGSHEPRSPFKASKPSGDSTANHGVSMTMIPPESPIRAKNHPDQSAVPPSSPRSLVNNEFCSACSGAGTLICCESCPRSFHFLCADPPIDPENVPDENWFCDECRWARLEPSPSPEGGSKLVAAVPRELWTCLRDYIVRLNPKLFTLPKRIRKMASEEEGGEGGRALNVEFKGDPSKNIAGGLDTADVNFSHQASHHSHSHHHHHLHKERLAGKGYCHHCGQGAAMEENKLLINCDDCTLKWHLDCLPYPLAVYPSGHRHWACPVHLTRNNLAHLPPNTVQQILDRTRESTIKITDWPEKPIPRTDLSILPETTVRLQFGWSTIRSPVGGHIQASAYYEGCRVPEVVKEAYMQIRATSAHEAKLLRYYETYDYTDRAMETNMVI